MEREQEEELWEKQARCGVGWWGREREREREKEKVVGEARAVWWGKGERELKISGKRVMNRGSALILYGVQCV